MLLRAMSETLALQWPGWVSMDWCQCPWFILLLQSMGMPQVGAAARNHMNIQRLCITGATLDVVLQRDDPISHSSTQKSGHCTLPKPHSGSGHGSGSVGKPALRMQVWES